MLKPADGRLARLPESAAVVGDDPVARLQQGRALLLPRVPIERVAVDEHDRLSLSVVLVIEIDVRAVLGPTVPTVLAQVDTYRKLSQLVDREGLIS